MRNRRTEFPKVERSPRRVQAGGGEWEASPGAAAQRPAPRAPGPRAPHSAIPKLQGRGLAPAPEDRAAPRGAGGPPRGPAPYLLRHPGLAAAASFRRGARRPPPRPQVAARPSATPAAAGPRSAREEAGPGPRTAAGGPGGRAPRPAPREGWSRFRPEDPRPRRLAGRRRELHFPEGAAAPAGGGASPGRPGGSPLSAPQPGTPRSCAEGCAQRPAGWPAPACLRACARPSILSLHPARAARILCAR